MLIVTSGRADACPLRRVIELLGDRATVLDLEHQDLAQCVRATERAISKHGPDVLLVLGDRFEILAAASAATVARVPIAHCHGGERTYGAFDDQIRHAVSKLAHVHLVAAEPFAETLRRMGERNIFVVGAPGLDNLVDLPPRKPEKRFVVTYHPVTLEKESGIHALLDALDQFPDYEAIWTGVNNDPGSGDVRRALDNHSVKSPDLHGYLLYCRSAACVVGNSSSGIIESPSLGIPAVNIGNRQAGRLRGPSVFDCGEEVGEIVRAIDAAFAYDGPFDNPYGGPGASQKIVDTLMSCELEQRKPWPM